MEKASDGSFARITRKRAEDDDDRRPTRTRTRRIGAGR
jgi:hypothetical protein